LLIVKKNLPIQFVQSMWFKCLILHLCPKLNFLSIRQFSQDILPRLVEKTNQLYVFFAFAKCHYVIVSFDIWMSKGAYDVFALVINFPSNDWQSKHVTISLFETTKTTWQALAKILTKLLDNMVYIKKLLLMSKMKDLISMQ